MATIKKISLKFFLITILGLELILVLALRLLGIQFLANLISSKKLNAIYPVEKAIGILGVRADVVGTTVATTAPTPCTTSCGNDCPSRTTGDGGS